MRLVREGGLLEVVEDDVVGRVVGLADLLQDHAALALQLLGVEGRVLQDVGEDVDGERHVVLQHLGVVGGLLARGVGVEVAADLLDLARRCRGRCARLGALEGHVLEQVGDAVVLRRLVAGADADTRRRTTTVSTGSMRSVTTLRPLASVVTRTARSAILRRDLQAATRRCAGVAHVVLHRARGRWASTSYALRRARCRSAEARRQSRAARRSRARPRRGTWPDGRSRAPPRRSRCPSGARPRRRRCRSAVCGSTSSPVRCVDAADLGERRLRRRAARPRNSAVRPAPRRVGHRRSGPSCGTPRIASVARAVAARAARTAAARNC